MDLDGLKSVWQSQEIPAKSMTQMREMVREGRHPALARTRKMLVYEAIAWGLFLVVFYNAFDGHLKPIWLNGLLVVAFLFLLAHHVLGIRLMSKHKANESLAVSLEHYRTALKRFAQVNFISRLLAIGSLLFFFLYGIEWNTKKYFLSAGFVLIIVIQLYALNRIWLSRISDLAAYWQEED